MGFVLPKKIPVHLLRLIRNYSTDGDYGQLRAILEAARVHVREGAEYYNYNGGVYGHGVILFLPLDVLAVIRPNEQGKLIDALLVDLRQSVGGTSVEQLAFLHLEPNNPADEEYTNSVAIVDAPRIPAELLNIWKPDLIRVFFSHRDKHRAKVQELANALEPFGFTCFVAHHTITPMSEWRQEIMHGLQSMEILVVFLTDDFDTSIWTNQEVGFALGAGIPVIPVKLEKKAPPGFISHLQAMKGSMDDPSKTAEQLLPWLTKETRSQAKVQTALVRAFADSPGFGETVKRFDRMQKIVQELSDKELQIIIKAYAQNDQLHGADYLKNKSERLKKFLRATTQKSFEIRGNQIKEETLPF